MDTSTAVEASSPTFSSSSSCSSDDEMYDVFLSFRGEDTRKTFTDHLYWRLKHARVDVFIDENELRGGEIIPDEHNQIIQRSRISVIIFSRRYADSIWCLEELEKIMECRRTLGQIVLPIFYDVDPSDVREQTGSFAEAFQTHEVRFHGVKDKEEKIQSWRKSLTEAVDLDGLVFSKIDGYEGVFIRKIIDDINRKLKSTCLGIATKQVGIQSSKQEISNYVQVQVGIDSRLQDISTHLDVGGSNDVHIIGIWGMGGMGKTMVAEAIFNKYHPSFDAKSFIQNMRERKLVDLQEQLLFDIFKPTKVEGSSMDERMYEIKKRLPTRNVLVILDDICHADQIKALAIERDSFGPGSRIVITTRNKHLLEIIEVDKICCLKAMNEVEALELLSLHAFKSHCPNEGYLELSREVVGYCGGLPLALKVLGSSLYKRSTIEWRDALDKWKTLPPKEIHEKLKLSYDELPDNYLRDAFLDISCFFIGMDMKYVMQILDRRFLSPVKGLSVLLEQSLLTVGEDNKLMMHDLVRDMGREIVRAQSPNIPRKRSRLWHHEDVKDVLRNKSGTDEIEGLILDLKESDEPRFSTKAFRTMRRLRLLKLNYVQLTGSYKHFSKELRWFCWHGFPLKVIPKDFYQENLVAIDLSYSKLIRVWEDSHLLLLVELKSLDLSHSACLKILPDFSRLPNLEELILRGCKRLLWDHCWMTGWLGKLKFLDLGYCNLTDDVVVRNLGFLSPYLKILRLDGNGFDCLLFSFDRLFELEELTLNDCKNLRQITILPSTLKHLKANYCTALESISGDIPNMRELDLKDCRKLEYISGLCGSLPPIETIHMEGCTNLSAQLLTNMLKLWAKSGRGGLFFSGNDIPWWFPTVVNEDEIVYIDVPNSGVGALAVCIIYSSDDSESSGRLSLTVANRTQRTVFSIFPMTVSGVTPHEDYLWVGRVPNNVLNLKGGDKVHARAEFLREEGKKHLKLKKTGLCLEKDFMREGYKIDWESKPYTYPATDDDAWPSKHSHNLIRKTTRLYPPEFVERRPLPSLTLSPKEKREGKSEDASLRPLPSLTLSPKEKREGKSEDALRKRWFGRNRWFGQPVLEKRLSHVVSMGANGASLEEFSLEELLEATSNFSEEHKIGTGSYGSVYYARLTDGRQVAIKRAETSASSSYVGGHARRQEDKDNAFVNELESLSRLNHKNLVRLLGFFEDTKERILVYEYMNNATLHDHLHKLPHSPLVSWAARINVALDAARGVEYLHMYAVPPVIHRDIKSSNILLDDTLHAKVSDFGLSLMGPEDEESHLSLRAAGTFGYMDPEYYRLQQLTTKSDVYSFGVVLLELLSGYNAIHKNENGVPRNVVDFVVPYIVNDEIHRILDPKMPAPNPFEIEAVAYVGYLAADCVSLEGRDRPSMTDIVSSLERALSFCLASVSRSSSSTQSST